MYDIVEILIPLIHACHTDARDKFSRGHNEFNQRQINRFTRNIYLRIQRVYAENYKGTL